MPLHSHEKAKLIAAHFTLLLGLVPSLALAQPTQVEVIRVIDGDTLEVRISGNVSGWNTFDADLIGINTPEPRSRCEDDDEAKRERMLAAMASAHVRQAIYDAETIAVELMGEDSLNRPLVVIYVDGESLNDGLLKHGHALPYAEGTHGQQWCGK